MRAERFMNCVKEAETGKKKYIKKFTVLKKEAQS